MQPKPKKLQSEDFACKYLRRLLFTDADLDNLEVFSSRCEQREEERSLVPKYSCFPGMPCPSCIS